jgi:hypothetical protein
MKLYTEEQVREMLMSIDTNIYISDSYIDSKIDLLTPIELPSDEEIWEKIEDSPYSLEYDTGFAQGVKWVIEQIKQQDGKE